MLHPGLLKEPLLQVRMQAHLLVGTSKKLWTAPTPYGSARELFQ